MAEENTKEVAEESEKKSNTLPLILGGVAVLVLGVVGGMFAGDSMKSDTKDSSTPTETTVSTDVPETPVSTVEAGTTVFSLGEFSVNLKDPSTMRILQMTIDIECETAVKAKLEAKTPQIRDSILMFTSEYTASNLAGMDGKRDLADEILLRINSIMKPERVERVYFTKFLIGK
jgi:flagellar basal body-associated protein FliL